MIVEYLWGKLIEWGISLLKKILTHKKRMFKLNEKGEMDFCRFDHHIGE